MAAPLLTEIDHVAIAVRDLDAAIEWYGAVLGFRVVTPPAEMRTDDAQLGAALADAQRALAADAQRRAAERTRAVATVAEAIEAAEDGFAKLPWATVGPDGERELNAHAVSVRCLQTPDGGVPDDAAAGDLIAVVGRAY
jgi:prolyl-tRNA synthetase